MHLGIHTVWVRISGPNKFLDLGLHIIKKFAMEEDTCNSVNERLICSENLVLDLLRRTQDTLESLEKSPKCDHAVLDELTMGFLETADRVFENLRAEAKIIRPHIPVAGIADIDSIQSSNFNTQVDKLIENDRERDE